MITPDDEAYEQLADALDRLPNGFPRTPSNVEIALLKKICPPEEARFAALLRGEMEAVDRIAARLGMHAAEVRRKGMELVRRGLAWFDREGGKPRFRLAPFVVGIYEAQLGNMDHEFAHLFEHWLADGGAAGLMKYDPAFQRVVPARGALPEEWILPYDDVRAMLEEASSFHVRDCICRVQRRRAGKGCDYPLDVCLYFSTAGHQSGTGDITREEALAVLDRAEDAGLVHSVSNVARGVWYVCNCCGCCCAILRGITEFGIERSVARSNYHAVIDQGKCTGCGVCLDRCQVGAISVREDVTLVDRSRCIGCGLCVTGCATGAAELRRLPDAEMVHPPEDFAAWERQRRKNRETDARRDELRDDGELHRHNHGEKE